MADYSIAYVLKKDFDATQYKAIADEAEKNIAAATDDTILMLQVTFNSPTVSIAKALPATEENLSKIASID